MLQPIGMKDATHEQPRPEARRASAAIGHGGSNVGFKCELTAFAKGPDGAMTHMLIDGLQKVPRLSQPPAMAPSTV